jgi:hypothetical protein
MEERDVEDLRELEESLWRPETRFDRRHLEATLAPGFREHGRSGHTYLREGVLRSAPRPLEARLPLPAFEARMIGPDVALVTYRSEVATPEGTEAANRCSIWRRDGDRWLLEFHQGTPTEGG